MEHPFPPKNRKTPGLSYLVIEVEHADGVTRTDPVGAAASAIVGATGEDLRLNPKAEGLTIEIIRLHELVPVPGVTSALSGEPALVYRTHDLEIPLTRQETHRLLDRSLTPAEYFALRDRFGLFFEIEADFYDLDTGTAVQSVTGKPLLER